MIFLLIIFLRHDNLGIIKLNNEMKNYSLLETLRTIHFNSFQRGLEFHIKTSHLICIANLMTGFYMKYITVPKWLKLISEAVVRRRSSK